MLEQIVGELLGVPIETAIVYFICVVLGVCINWAKRCNELEVAMFEYWRSNPARSQAAILGTLCAFFLTLMTDPESGKLTYIAIGFACDNLLNKAPMTGVAADVLARQEAEIAVQNQRIRELKEGINA
jgi:hypothetical protein